MPKAPRKEQSVTQLLKLWRQDGDAHVELMERVYPELKKIARRHLSREYEKLSLQPTLLLHEAYMRLRQQERVEWQSRAHFFAVASGMMRRVLVEHARARLARKRRAVLVPIDDAADVPAQRDVEVIALEEALAQFEGLYPDEAQVVELRYFGGLTIEEAAKVLGVGHSTVERSWSFAKAWLLRRLA